MDVILILQGGMDYGGLSDYPHCQIKLKKYKTSENEQSHGSFFLRVGGLGKDLSFPTLSVSKPTILNV